ncbi:condensation domain-containing protein [Nonomuraea sp. NPDC003707]
MHIVDEPSSALDRTSQDHAERAPESDGADHAQEDPYAEIVAGIFARVTRLAEVPHDVSLFDLGGSSLDAARVCTRLSSRFGVPVPVSQIVEHPTVAGVALRIGEILRETRTIVEGHVPRTTDQHDPITGGGDAVPLDGMQASFCVAHAFDPEDTAPVCVLLWELEGPVDLQALEDALHDVGERHEALRASYVMRGRPPRPVALVTRNTRHPSLPITEIGDVDEGLARWIDRQLNRCLDIAKGEIWRYAVLRSPHTVVLGVAIHHVAFDGWSQGLLARDLSEAYAARSTGRPALFSTTAPSLLAVAREKRRQQAHVSLGRQKEYWLGALAGTVDLELPVPDPAVHQAAAHTPGFHVAADDVAALDRVARAGHATRFTALLAIYNMTLRDLTGQSAIAVGVPVARRGGEALDAALTCSINTVCIPLRRLESSNWTDALSSTRTAAAAAMAAQDVDFLNVVRLLNPRRGGRNPIFQTMFALQDTPPPLLTLTGCVSTHRRIPPRRAMFELVLEMFPLPDGAIQAEFSYQAEKVAGSFVERLAAAYYQNFRDIISEHWP